jgi:glycosyltransferase involved in cell wall biosynthesis
MFRFQKKSSWWMECLLTGRVKILKEEETKSDTRIIYMPHRCGRGLALKIGIENVKGDIIIFQDADLELDPADYPALIQPIQDGKATIVFGSRFLGKSDSYMSFLQRTGNKFLTSMVKFLI